MTKFFLIIIGILLASLIFAILTILLQGKIYKGKLRKQEADFLNQYNDLQFRQQEILNNAKYKKDKLHLWILNYKQYWLMRLLSKARRMVSTKM